MSRPATSRGVSGSCVGMSRAALERARDRASARLLERIRKRGPRGLGRGWVQSDYRPYGPDWLEVTLALWISCGLVVRRVVGRPAEWSGSRTAEVYFAAGFDPESEVIR